MTQMMAYMDGIMKEISPGEASRYEIIAKLDLDRQTLHLMIPANCPMIARRTAERQARSIAKSKFCDFVLEESDEISVIPSAPTPMKTEVAVVSTVIEPKAPEPAFIEPKAPEPTVIEPKAPEPAFIEPKAPEPVKAVELKPTRPAPTTPGTKKIFSEATSLLGFEEGDFIAALFLWRLLVNTIKLDNVVKIGDSVTLQWEDGSALEFMIEDNKQLSNLLVLSALGRKADLIKGLWKNAMNWQKLIKQ